MRWLYFVYRILSFDSHGKSLTGVAEDVFEDTINWPVIDINRLLEIIADEYMFVFMNHDWLRTNTID